MQRRHRVLTAVAARLDTPNLPWLLDHPLLPKLTTLTDAFARTVLNGVRIFLGGTPGNDTAEVRINGRVDRAASRQLYEVPWPRLDKLAYASTYLLAIHPS